MSSPQRVVWTSLAILFLLAAAPFEFATGKSAGRPSTEEPPRLVVLLVLDQFIPDYLVRFRGYFSGGLKRLVEEGAVFPNAEYNHAFTETAAGHAVIATGCQPAKNGIVANSWVEYASGRRWYSMQDDSVQTVGAPGLAGRSPANLKRPTLADWLKAGDPASKIVAVSRKDRGAIPLAGKNGDLALWFDTRSGRFVTSSYYADRLPEWVQRFEVERPAASFYRVWDRLLNEEAYFASREDYFPAEGDSARSVFPHAPVPPGTNGPELYAALTGTPFSDEQLLELAAAAVLGEALGQDDRPDLLGIALSATDAIGHRYGPLSQEIQDHVLRVDRALGRFFAFLDEHVGLQHTLIVLTSDHGVLPMPEELQRRGFAARRVPRQEVHSHFERISHQLSDRLGYQGRLFRLTNVGVLLDRSALQATGMSADRLAALVADELRQLPMIEAVFTRAQLMERGQDGDPLRTLFRNNFDPERMADLFIVYKKYHLVSGASTGTGHGSPHEYDRRVPIVFFGKGIAPGEYSERIAVVDLAPTLAHLLGVSPPPDVDGRVVRQVLLGQVEE